MEIDRGTYHDCGCCCDEIEMEKGFVGGETQKKVDEGYSRRAGSTLGELENTAGQKIHLEHLLSDYSRAMLER